MIQKWNNSRLIDALGMRPCFRSFYLLGKDGKNKLSYFSHAIKITFHSSRRKKRGEEIESPEREEGCLHVCKQAPNSAPWHKSPVSYLWIRARGRLGGISYVPNQWDQRNQNRGATKRTIAGGLCSTCIGKVWNKRSHSPSDLHALKLLDWN